jgi:hypothetical protein
MTFGKARHFRMAATDGGNPTFLFFSGAIGGFGLRVGIRRVWENALCCSLSLWSGGVKRVFCWIAGISACWGIRGVGTWGEGLFSFAILGLLGCGVVMVIKDGAGFGFLSSCFRLSLARRARNSRLGLVCLGLLPLMNGTFDH